VIMFERRHDDVEVQLIRHAATTIWRAASPDRLAVQFRLLLTDSGSPRKLGRETLAAVARLWPRLHGAGREAQTVISPTERSAACGTASAESGQGIMPPPTMRTQA